MIFLVSRKLVVLERKTKSSEQIRPHSGNLHMNKILCYRSAYSHRASSESIHSALGRNVTRIKNQTKTKSGFDIFKVISCLYYSLFVTNYLIPLYFNTLTKTLHTLLAYFNCKVSFIT